MAKDKKVGYSLQMLAVRPLNADGSMVFNKGFVRKKTLDDGSVLDVSVPGGIWGGAGTFDFSALSGNDGKIKVRENGVEEEQTFDITAVGDKSAVTVDEMITAINAMTFSVLSGITASKDADTGRLIVVSDQTVMSPLFEILNTDDDATETLGINNFFTFSFEPKGWTASPTVTTGDTVSQTSGNGPVTDLKTDDRTTSYALEFTDAEQDSYLKQALVGGWIDPDDGAYYSADTDVKPPKTSIILFEPIYGAGSYGQGDNYEFKMDMFTNCTAIEGNMDKAESAFNNQVISITAFQNNASSLGFYAQKPVSTDVYNTLRSVASA